MSASKETRTLNPVLPVAPSSTMCRIKLLDLLHCSHASEQVTHTLQPRIPLWRSNAISHILSQTTLLTTYFSEVNINARQDAKFY